VCAKLGDLVNQLLIFETFCNWDNLGRGFPEVRIAWREKLTNCSSFQGLASCISEFESHLVPERCSYMFATRRLALKEILHGIASMPRLPSLQSLCLTALVNSKDANLSTIPVDLLEPYHQLFLLLRNDLVKPT